MLPGVGAAAREPEIRRGTKKMMIITASTISAIRILGPRGLGAGKPVAL